jgi:hypothetical protein
MEGNREAKEIAEVQARLAERFPQLDEDVIAAAVRLAHSELTGGLRDYVPILVEHNARDRLAAIAGREQPGEAGDADGTSDADPEPRTGT